MYFTLLFFHVVGRTLRMYKNSIEHKPGCNTKMYDWMHAEAKKLKLARDAYYGILSFDEVKIQVIPV